MRHGFQHGQTESFVLRRAHKAERLSVARREIGVGACVMLDLICNAKPIQRCSFLGREAATSETEQSDAPRKSRCRVSIE
jgi:hypothetical protein